jgi:hypothetical protein
MFADPPQLVGQRVRFLVVVKDEFGEVERARARAWTDPNIETYYKMEKENSKAIAVGFMTGLVKAVEVGEMNVVPSMMNVERQ